MTGRLGMAFVLAAGLSVFATGPALAQEAGDSAYIFNSLLFLMGGFLVMWMAAGFCMLEAGLVRTKNVADICLKNIGLYAIAGIMFYLIGYRLMYEGVNGGLFGTPGIWSAGEISGAIRTGYLDGEDPPKFASASDWFFQMVFVATAASIVSGAVAERIRLFPFFIFVALLTAVIYPVQGAWHWGAGWLQSEWFSATFGAPFKDFAGSTIVHSTGGWAALMGVILLGPRMGKYDAQGRVRPIPGSNMPLATLGTFILWLGWFGFNGASQLAMGTISDVVAVSQIFANTNMAAAGGVVTAILLTKAIYGKVDLTMTLNGALAGLVSITAEPLTPTVGQAILIGAAGSALVVFAVPLLDRLKIDDVVGAIPVHLVAGIWGTLAVPLTNGEAGIIAQLIGILSIGAYVTVASLGLWTALRHTTGIRLTPEHEASGSDVSELGLEAYPEFGRGTQSVSA